MALFSTAFVPPPPLTDLTLFANVPASSVDLAWTATSHGVDFGGYRVSRSLDGGLTWILLELITSESLITHRDYTAPLTVSLLYRVTVSTLDFESDPVFAATMIEASGWWMVRPADPALTFQLTWVDDHRKSRQRPREVYRPLGRSRPVVISGEQQGWEGSIRASVPHAYRAVIDNVVTIGGLADEFVYIKSPFGEVMPSQIGDIEVARGSGGHQTLTFPFTEVA